MSLAAASASAVSPVSGEGGDVESLFVFSAGAAASRKSSVSSVRDSVTVPASPASAVC